MNVQRLKISVRGVVQGVGFRPFIYRLATELGLNGWVLNSAQGVFIEVEGVRDVLSQFLLRIDREKPVRASIQSLESSLLDAVGYDRFEISHSEQIGPKTVLVLPDIATCSDCLREIMEPNDRRYRYPFTNCTNCGPRFTIVEALPYDRPNTSMKRFEMCADCYREYCDPMDRRFHAQPVACPCCGPKLELRDPDGSIVAQRDDALIQGAHWVRKGKIVALKGLGGFQLIVDARNEAAIRELARPEGPAGEAFCIVISLDRTRSAGLPSIRTGRASAAIPRISDCAIAPQSNSGATRFFGRSRQSLLWRDAALHAVASSIHA